MESYRDLTEINSMECPVDNSHKVHTLTQTMSIAVKIVRITTGIC